MNSMGFIRGDMVLAMDGYDVSAISPFMWDRQTIVLLCDSRNTIENIRNILRSNRKPNSTQYNTNYDIDGFVNLDYNPRETDPANRNVRIVYCDMEHMDMKEVNERFQCSYMIRIKAERSETNGTPRISREISEISG